MTSHATTGADILGVWERGAAADHVARALLLAAAADHPPNRPVAQLPVGVRDRLVLDLRERWYGRRIEAVARCPGCGVELDLEFTVDDARWAAQGGGAEAHEVQAEGYRVRIRPLTSRDLLQAGAVGEAGAARRALLAGCVVEAAGAAGPVAPADLPPGVVTAVAEALAALDPGADVRVSLTCEACGHRWDSPFDVPVFVWAEVERSALSLLREVHVLAGAYGWSEAEVLSLTAVRRRAYLALVTDG